MDRRQLLKGLAAGGLIVAGELWIPGQKLISIPKRGLDCAYSLGYIVTRETLESTYYGPSIVGLLADYHASMRQQLDNMLFPRPAYQYPVLEHRPKSL